ncbi:MAG: hypothetical protein GY861_25240, partial [bacterium]|nr:hypothetical protein [bacterium]
MIVYKVTNRFCGSINLSPISKYYCKYIKGKTTIPVDERLPLMAFETQEQGENFLGNYPGNILRCKAKCVKEQNLFMIEATVSSDIPNDVDYLANIIWGKEGY